MQANIFLYLQVLPYVPNELCVPLVTMDKVDISTPDGHTLIHGFNFEFREVRG